MFDLVMSRKRRLTLELTDSCRWDFSRVLDVVSSPLL